MSDPPAHAVPDRYADAVRARRGELRVARAGLLGAHRAELRHGLAVARLAASTELAAALTALDRELRDHVDRADRAARAALPALVAAAVDRLAAGTARRWADLVLPGVRRVAALRGVTPPVAWPGAAADPLTVTLTGPVPVSLPTPDTPPTGTRALLAGATGGTWRLALLPAAALSAAGLPALGGRALLPAAGGVGLAVAVTAVRARRTAADRLRLRRWCAEVVAAARHALETELTRRLLEVERVAGAGLDEAVTRRRAEVEAELRALAPGPERVDA